MVQVPPSISVKKKEHKGNEAAHYLESIVNEMAVDNWEFYRIDSIGVQVAPGCFASLVGKKTEQYVHYVVSFRKQR